MVQEELYKSVLRKLSFLPTEYLQQVDSFLSSLGKKMAEKEQNRSTTLSLAGSWSDMSDEDFQDYLQIAKDTGKELFTREIEL